MSCRHRMTFARALLTLFTLVVTAAGAADFKKDIQPILKARCFECHSEQAKKEKAGYVFDNLKRYAARALIATRAPST